MSVRKAFKRRLGAAAAVSLAVLGIGAAPAQPAGIADPWSQRAAESPAQRILEARIRQLGQDFQGDVGIAVRDVQTGWTTAFDGNTFFPQQSVSKFWVALTALDRADRGELDLEQRVTLTRNDLTLFHQPIAAQVGANGYSTTLSTLMFRAMTQSDNTCNDFVLRRAGGPEAVREMFRRKGIQGIRFGPGERLLQTRLAGLDGWRPEYQGQGFYAARSGLPIAVRQAAFDRYVADPMDGATPIGVVDALARLQLGQLLSAASTQRLLSIMSQTRTGAQRLKGGLAPGWRLAHKTGTGQVLGSVQTGYNDIGVITSPDGRHYAVAVMIRRTSAPLGSRMALMQNTVRAVIDFDRNQSGSGSVAAP
ncbi:class A beta-lactamase [Allosphingosinicella sp.]|jgi:beta-lactamase class A|uniref:class A beta-lactamase n=1 Tax=Allosphingosinicella sp. TaxID=2823234 RepID=UPI002F1A3FC9